VGGMEYWWRKSRSEPQPRRKTTSRRVSADPGSSLDFQLHVPAEAEGAVEIYRAGDLCPICGFARLEYDGYFNVYCPICGFRTGARGVCT